MKKLKGYVRNKTEPKGSIAEGYVTEEALTFGSHYFRDVTMKFNRLDRNVDPPPPTCQFQLSRNKPDQDLSLTNRSSAPIIEDWVSDSEDESETKTPQIVLSFVQSTKQVKSPRPSVQHVETSIHAATPKPASPKPTSNGKRRNRKACFVCKSLDHLIKDCDYHEKKMAQPIARNHAHRSKPVPITVVRPVSTDVPKIKANLMGRLMKDFSWILSSGPTWLFDIDSLTKTMNYQPVTGGNQSNPSAGFQENFDAEKAREESDQQYVLFLCGLLVLQILKTIMEMLPLMKRRMSLMQISLKFKDYFEDSINEVNTAGALVPAVGKISPNGTNTFSAARPSNAAASPTHEFFLFIDASKLPNDPDMPNWKTLPILMMLVQRLALTIWKHLSQSMTRVAKDQGGLSQMFNDDFHTCMFACFLSQEEPKRKVWVLVDFPYRKRAIGTKWVFRNKKDERGIVVRNKARLVTQGHIHEEGIDFEEVFTPVARIEGIRLFLACASFMGFMVYHMDVKSAFLYGTIKEEVYVCQPLGFEDPDNPDKVYKVIKALYGLNQAPRAWYETLANYLLENGFQRGKIDQTLFIKRQKGATDSESTIGLWVVLSCMESLRRMLHVTNFFKCWLPHHTTNGSQFTMSNPHQELASPVQAVSGKDIINPLMADNLPKIVWYSTHHVALIKSWLVQKQMALGKDKANPLIVDSLLKTICTSIHHLLINEVLTILGQRATGDLSTHTTKYTSPSLTQKVFANMRKVGKGFSGVETPLFEGMLVAQEVAEGDDEEHGDGVLAAGDTTEGDVSVARDEVLIVQPTPPQSPQPQPQPQPHQDAGIPMNLFQEVMDTCTTLSRRVEHLELDKIAQALEITKRVETFDETVMDDVSNQGRMIAEIDQDADVVLEDDKEVVDDDKKVDESADIQGRKAESQAEIYKIDLEHANKVLSMQEDESEPTEVQEVVDVVTTAKIITEVVTATSETITTASTTITAAETQVPAVTLTAAPARVTDAPSRKRKGVVIRDPEQESTTSTIIPAKTKSKDKGKGILVEEPKPLKKQQQIEQDEKYARELEAKLNNNIDWDEAIDHVNKKAKEDNVVKRYQAMKKKPQTEAQARKNMMVYLKNVDGFKMDYFKGMSYDDIRSIFEKYFDSNVAFLLKTKEQIKEEESRALKRLNETPAEKVEKRRKLDEEVEDLKRHLQIVPNEVYIEATPLARKVPVVDYEIIELNNKPYYKIIRADDTNQLYDEIFWIIFHVNVCRLSKANPRRTKAITTRSGMTYKEPPIPPPGVEEQEPTEEITNTELPSTKDIQPPEIILRQDQQSLIIQYVDIPSIKKVEQINKIDFIDVGGIDFDSEEIENFFNDDSIPFGVEDSPFNMEEDIFFLESFLIEDPSPPHLIIPNQTKFPIEEPKHSFNMGYEHFNTNLVTNDVAESSTKNLVPIPHECKVTSENGSKSIKPVNDNSLAFTTISNPLFNNDKINSDEINSHVESNSNESTSNHDTMKFDYLDEFYGPLIPIHILEEERIRREHADYISQIEMLFTINQRPHPLTYSDTNVESFSSFPIPIQESESQQEEIKVVAITNDVLPPRVENEDSNEEVDAVVDLRVDNFIQNFEHEFSKCEDSDFDNLPVPLPPPEPPDEELDFEKDFEKEISVVRNTIVKFECIDARVKFDVFNDDVLFYFMFAKVFSLLSAESEDTIFDPGWIDKEIPISEGSPITRSERFQETYKNVSQEIRDQLNAEAEAVQIIHTGIDNDIYSTVDACPNTCEMWKAIKRIGNVAGARETVGSTMMQKSGIQYYNCKEFRHGARECQKPKRAKDVAYHKEKMLLCKQEEAGIHVHPEQSKSVHDTYPIKQDVQNVIIDSSDMSNDRVEINQNDDDNDLAKERELLASLIEKIKCKIDESKNCNKFLETSNKDLIEKLK
nr:putative ribonuclease H-like domain-containing protein [Tanacetum cinerariifolium]